MILTSPTSRNKYKPSINLTMTCYQPFDISYKTKRERKNTWNIESDNLEPFCLIKQRDFNQINIGLLFDITIPRYSIPMVDYVMYWLTSYFTISLYCIYLIHCYCFTAEYPNLDQLRLAKNEKELRENILKSAKQNYAPKEVWEDNSECFQTRSLCKDERRLNMILYIIISYLGTVSSC